LYAEAIQLSGLFLQEKATLHDSGNGYINSETALVARRLGPDFSFRSHGIRWRWSRAGCRWQPPLVFDAVKGNHHRMGHALALRSQSPLPRQQMEPLQVFTKSF
jgi:hypothetical protein